jgi:uncharacterized OB-fold protein
MPVYEYRGLGIDIPDNDSEYKEYFEACREHRLVVRKCLECGLLRGESGPGCAWCQSLRWEWHTVSGKGTIYSYVIAVHSVLAGFQDWVPYPIVLVELDEQRGKPDPADGLRITANLLDENMNPEKEENVAIGKRVEVSYLDLENGLTLPQFKLSDEPPQGTVWRYPV